MRLNKYLSYCGITSRRKADELIKRGEVSINGQIITDLSYKVNPEKDKVYVKGKIVSPPPKVYYLFYKPKGILTSLYDPYHKETLKPFLNKIPYRVFPVGRLDKHSEGLILLTNDGDLANFLLHPKNEVIRTYQVWITSQLDSQKIKKLITRGIYIENRLVKPINFKFLKQNKKYWVYEISVKEGVKREIRKMIAYLGSKVYRLLRIKFGPLYLKNLKPGEIRPLNKEELANLINFVNQRKSS